jgi:hypothetical protein
LRKHYAVELQLRRLMCGFELAEAASARVPQPPVNNPSPDQALAALEAASGLPVASHEYCRLGISRRISVVRS